MPVNNYFMRFPNGKPKALTLSYDDDVTCNVPFCEILDKYGLKCTFNINSGLFKDDNDTSNSRTMKKTEGIEFFKKCIENGHEVAIHGETHPFLDCLPASVATTQVLNDRIALEKMFGRIIRGMAYPQGTYNDEVVNCLRACGISYSRTTVQTEKFDIPTDWLRLPSTCRHKNPRLMELAKKFAEATPINRPQLFYLWGHSYEFEADNNWNVIEEFAEYTGGHDDIWYATNIEIYDYVEAYRSLVFSVNGSRVYNPTAITLYLEKAGVTYCVKPGESIEL